MEILGIDIGGSGVKAAVVDTKIGKLVSQKVRFPTPDPSSPKKYFLEFNQTLLRNLNGQVK